MADIEMKVVGREKVEVGRDKYSDFYLVMLPGYKDRHHKNTTYFGNGVRGALDSFGNIARRYEDGWEDKRLEDLRDKNVPVPEKVKEHINKLIQEENEW